MSTFSVSLGSRPILSAEEQRDRARRAREVLDGAGWLFDEFMSARNRDLLDTTPLDTAERERAYQDIQCAAALKAHLIRIVETQQAKDAVHERNRAE